MKTEEQLMAEIEELQKLAHVFIEGMNEAHRYAQHIRSGGDGSGTINPYLNKSRELYRELQAMRQQRTLQEVARTCHDNPHPDDEREPSGL